MIAGCASQVGYEMAIELATAQENELGKTYHRDHPAFLECITGKLLEVENGCTESGREEGNEIMVMEFNEKGKIVSTYYNGYDPTLKCMSKKLIGLSCKNPPHQNLFAKFEMRTLHGQQ
jgi:hypothetical protein